MTDIEFRENSLLVHAYIDGELDPANALAFEKVLARDAALAAEYERIKVYQELVRAHFPRAEAPHGLPARIKASIGLSPLRRQHSWRALAASIAISAVLAAGSTSYVLRPDVADMEREAVLAAHIRSLMAPRPIDVASSDKHTVKPWFNGKIAASPKVVDLADASFPLVGGRLDVVDHAAVPTLVYGHAKHLISLTAVPISGRMDAESSYQTVAGYNVLHWSSDGVGYWAVSDLQSAELESFVRLFRSSQADK
jgi:anti-sigma factor RsiW